MNAINASAQHPGPAPVSPYVLLVDSDQAFVKTLRERLTADGIPAIGANNGYEAVRLLSSNPQLSVVVSDAEVPDMKSDEMMRIAGAVAPDRSLSWIFVTDGHGSAHIAASRLREAADVFEKPLVKTEEIVASIRRRLALVQQKSGGSNIFNGALYPNLSRLLEVLQISSHLLIPDHRPVSTVLAIIQKTLAAERSDRPRSLTSVGLEADESASTVARRIQSLVDSNVLMVRTDRLDHRRKLIRLNPDIEASAADLLERLREIVAR